MQTMVAIADLTGQPGSGPTLLEAVRNLRPVSIAEPGTREFSVVSVDAEPPRLIIVEKS
jgi:quinol monooxygenase YgiN